MEILSRLKIIYSKYSRLLPWASLIWGIASSFLLTRDYTKATRLGLFTCAFFLLIIAMATWYSYITKLTSQNQEELKKIHKSLHKRKDFLEFIGLTFTQYFVQYIFMFCIPFLYFKEEWFWLFFSVFFVGMTLWDPFWVRLFKIQFFRLSLRLIASCMAFGFLYAILFPKYLDSYYRWFTVMCVVVVFPWNFIFINRKIKIQTLFASFFLTTAISIHSMLPTETRFPVLSIWMENSKFSFEKPGKDTFEIINGNTVLSKNLIQKLRKGKQICAISPIIAPMGLYTQVFQEWYVDGKFVEKINLPAISGSKANEKYNTFSCKKFFPDLNDAHKITAKTFLKNGIYIGQSSLIISD